MPNTNIKDADLSELTLSALVNLLKLKGYDINSIFNEYEKKILDSVLTGAGPEYKHASISYLKKFIDEANNNTLL